MLKLKLPKEKFNEKGERLYCKYLDTFAAYGFPTSNGSVSGCHVVYVKKKSDEAS